MPRGRQKRDWWQERWGLCVLQRYRSSKELLPNHKLHFPASVSQRPRHFSQQNVFTAIERFSPPPSQESLVASRREAAMAHGGTGPAPRQRPDRQHMTEITAQKPTPPVQRRSEEPCFLTVVVTSQAVWFCQPF